MIRIYFIFSVLFLSFTVRSQLYFLPSTEIQSYGDDIDSANIKVWYVLNPVERVNISDSCIDMHILEIGNKFSKYYSYNVFKIDSLRIDFRKRHPKGSTAGIPHFVDDRYPFHEFFWSEYYKNYKDCTLTEYACMPSYVRNYWYSENMHEQNWQLWKDTLNITGYLCQKATCNFRGREYTAWFAPDIPISNGPWKFGGLPGLILKVYDTNKYYVFECIGIKRYQEKFPIKTYNYDNYIKIKREKLLKAWEMIFDNYIKFIGGTMRLRPGVTPPPPKKYHHPLELE
jgi:GLPGLI family protein